MAGDVGSSYGWLMRDTKISITLRMKLASELRAVAGSKGASSFVNEAVRQQRQARRLQRLLAEMDEEFGRVSESVAREVDAIAWPRVHRSADR